MQLFNSYLNFDAEKSLGGLIFHLLWTLILLTVVPAWTVDSKLNFWQHQRKGANGDGGQNPEQWFRAAGELGMDFIRLSPATWKGVGRDFLLGDADDFKGIPEEDFKQLEHTLNLADRSGVKIVLTMFSLPGERWRQQNGDRFDYRLWTEERFQEQACAFWRALAGRLKGHPAIVGYNPLNEPFPGRNHGFDSGNTQGFREWLQKQKETPLDLNRFNRRMVEAIRAVDRETPILLDCWFHAAPDGMQFIEPFGDDAVLFSFHDYVPWEFTTWRVNQGRFSYPAAMPADSSGTTRTWTAAELQQSLQPVIRWALDFHIPPARICAGEFGCDRRVGGAREYLRDLIRLFNEQQWHWAFYSFRSPDWDGLDYELGTKPLGGKYWQARESGRPHEELIERFDNPLWEIFKKEFAHQ